MSAKPKLSAGIIYFSDNGRLICIKCAGSSALYSGRDISGQAVEPVSSDDAAVLSAELGIPVACERGCTVYP